MKYVNLYTKKGELKAEYKKAIESINSTKIYTCKWVGNGRRRNVSSIYSQVVIILDTLKLKYKTGNDAPRGGLEGDYVKISKRAFQKIKNLKYKII